jgi:pimeloyl-ACP methyl ester carboxylesterase
VPAILALFGCCLLACDPDDRQDVEDADRGGKATVEVTSHWTLVGGERLHYLAAGPTGGRIVVLLHGAKYRARTWREVGTLTQLGKHGYRALAIDLPGFGESPRSAATPEEWLVKVLEALQLERPVIVSPSMSGRYALPLATSEPERLAGFVAVAPVGIGAHGGRLENITTPTLAIWGANDQVVPRQHADLLVGQVGKARKVIIPNADHAAYMSNADAFHAALLHFLDSEADWEAG